MAPANRGVLATLRALDPHDFELFVADVWQECQGWDTEVTQLSRDWGVDVVGRPPDGTGGVTALQAKRYTGQAIKSTEIQQYAALRQQYDDVTGVTVVTTSSFTEPALQLADRLDVTCIDGDDLVTIVERDGAQEIVDWYAAGRPADW